MVLSAGATKEAGNVDAEPYLPRLRAAAEQLSALAIAKTEGYRQAQLANIDWTLVADEFESVVARYSTTIERYATRVIRELQSVAISYRTSVEMELAMADLEAHLVDFESAEVDSVIASVWQDAQDELAAARGIVLTLPPIVSLSALRSAFEERRATHRQLDRASAAYRDSWPVPNVPEGVETQMTVAELPMAHKAAVLAARCTPRWQSTMGVLQQTLRDKDVTPSLPVLAELAAAIPTAVAQGKVELRGTAEMWHVSKIRLV